MLAVEPSLESSLDQAAGPASEAETIVLPLTRAERRRSAGHDAGLSAKDLPLSLLFVRILMVAALAGLVVLAGWAHPVALAAAFAWACAGVGWGWAQILDITPGRRILGVVALAGVLVATAVVIAGKDEPLRLVPIALASTVILTFLLQLVRRDGRAGLTDEVVATSGGLAFVGLGAGLVPMAVLDSGPEALTVAMAGVAVSLVADAISARLGPSVWALVMAAALGGLAGGTVGGLLGLPVWWHGVAVGAVSAVLSYAVRRLVEVRPGSMSLAGQIASACASVLAVGALAQVLVRIVVGV